MTNDEYENRVENTLMGNYDKKNKQLQLIFSDTNIFSFWFSKFPVFVWNINKVWHGAF